MKNKFRISSGWRAFLIIVEEVLAIVMSICYILCLVFIGQNDVTDQIFQKSLKYEESSNFNSLVEEQLDQVIRYTKLRSNFEVNGEYDGRKVVDIKDYSEDGIITGKQNSSVGYYLEDLIKWSQVGLNYSYIEHQESSHATDSYDTTQSSNDIEQKVDLEEEYLPVRGKKLFAYANNSFEQEELFNDLQATLDKIGEEYQEYKELKSSFANDNSNLKFYVIDYENDAFYTNAEDKDFKENDTIKDIGKYIILDSVNLEYESNMSVKESYVYSLLGKYATDFRGDYYIEIAVDTKYPCVDLFTEGKDYYYYFLPSIKGLLLGGVVAGFFALLILIILTLQAGHKKELDTNGIILIGFDKIKTEFAAGGLVFLAVIISSIYANFLYHTQLSTVLIACITGIVASVLNALFLLGYLSLVRRIKAETIWSNSFFAWFFDKCAEIGKACVHIINSRKITTKVILLFTSFVMINWFFITLGAEYDEINIFYIVIFIFNVFIVVLLINNAVGRNKILQGIHIISKGDLEYKIGTEKLTGENLQMAEAINHMGESLHNAVEISIKNERLKADLITNVSHDIKTPLTSIINYVDLLKREDITDEKIVNYIDILDKKSQRLKHLTEDLVEASKISSGNIVLNIERINFIELIHQTAAEFYEKFEQRNLTLITTLPDQSITIAADGRRLYRVLENLYNNVAKYAMENTRVYVDLTVDNGNVLFSIKNISTQALNINADELTERFIRGDVSRSTEGSGLGLSIAKNLTEAQEGKFSIYLDGDLFKVTIAFRKLL